MKSCEKPLFGFLCFPVFCIRKGIMNVLNTRQVIAALSLFAAFSTAPAFGMTVSYYLDQSNIDSFLPDGTNYLQVDITSTIAGTATFTVTPVYAFTTLSNFGIQAFGFNFSGANLNSIATGDFSLPGGWTVDLPPPSGMDGFGKYDFTVQDGGSNRQNPLTFTVTGLGGATSADTLGYFATLSSGGGTPEYFAVHLSDFGTTDPFTTSAYFAGTTPVPEPETYAMLLAGLGLVGFAARRKLA
jgi:hypothetical protein